MIVHCPACGRAHQASDALVGQRVRCTNTECSHVFIVEEDESGTPASHPAAAAATTPAPQSAPASETPAASAPAETPAAAAAEQTPAQPPAVETSAPATPASAPARGPAAPAPAIPHVPARPVRTTAETWSAVRTKKPSPMRFLADMTAEKAVRIGKILLLVGLALVVLARGGRNISVLGPEKDKSKLSNAKRDFKYEWSDRIEKETEDLKGAEKFKKRDEIEAKQKEKEHELSKTTWRDLERTSDYAADGGQIKRYWLEWLFLLGAVLLTTGLVTVGFYGSATERTVCLIMIAIITFSLFVGGNAWLGNFRIMIGT